MLAPSGTKPSSPFSRLKTKDCAGTSASLAEAVKDIGSSSFTSDSYSKGSRTGATFTSFTVTVMVSQSLKAPSLTQTSKV